MRNLLLLATLMVALPAAGRAATVLGPHDSSGKPLDCTDWATMRKAAAAPDRDKDEIWVLGFVSGLSAASSQADMLRDTRDNDVFYWLDGYCKTNPGMLLTNALSGPFFQETAK